MCGIIGYVGHRDARELLLAGLRRLEYRGYDSAGVAWRTNGRTECVRSVGNLEALDEALARRSAGASVALATAAASSGIGHTRWATHGAVTEENAHPHSDSRGRVRIVLNGIIENYLALRQTLVAAGIACRSQTDAEVIAHLIGRHYDGDLLAAVQAALPQLCGHYALVVMCEDEPETLVGARRECPLVVGRGHHEQFIASSITAFLAETREVVALHDEELVVLRPDDLRIYGGNGRAVVRHPSTVDWDDERCEKEGFETFMLKEIHEQPAAVRDTLASCRSGDSFGWLDETLATGVQRIIVVGCGTSYHAGLAGRLAIERWARVPVDVEIASEFRYRDPIIAAGTLVIGITQSGETADTLAAMRLARGHGAPVLAVTNAAGSQATRIADAVLLTRAGLEMGVAATKTFVAQVALLYALALRLAEARQAMAADQLAALGAALESLPEQIAQVLVDVPAPVAALAERLAWSPFFLYLGRLAGVPVALEGALKLKEISYVPTDAYAAGEMKHGPIALLCRETPVVCVAIEDRVLAKLLSNLSEVRARGAQVFAVAGEGSKELAEHAESIVYVPRADPLLQVILAVVPLQLLAYHVARSRGLNVDQPRNLAKTVTVE